MVSSEGCRSRLGGLSRRWTVQRLLCQPMPSIFSPQSGARNFPPIRHKAVLVIGIAASLWRLFASSLSRSHPVPSGPWSRPTIGLCRNQVSWQASWYEDDAKSGTIAAVAGETCPLVNYMAVLSRLRRRNPKPASVGSPGSWAVDQTGSSSHFGRIELTCHQGRHHHKAMSITMRCDNFWKHAELYSLHHPRDRPSERPVASQAMDAARLWCWAHGYRYGVIRRGDIYAAVPRRVKVV